MNAALEKQLAALSLEEKAEVIEFLTPAVHGMHGHDADDISPDLLAELERRMDEDDADPSGGMSLEEFDARLRNRG